MVARVVLAAALISTAGCYAFQVCAVDAVKESATYLRVEYQAEGIVGLQPPPEVHAAATFTQVQPSVKTIGLRFPDSCVTENIGKATGEAASTRDLMGTECGVWLAELERALTEQGYKVISWSAIRQEQDTKHISTYEAARALGAQVVLVVNSMEQDRKTRGTEFGASYKYFVSNARGERLAPYAPRDERSFLISFAKQNAARLFSKDDVLSVGASLDVTAVLADTGESIWFFRHGITHSHEAQTGMRFLFRKVLAHRNPVPNVVPFMIPDTLVPVRPEGLVTVGSSPTVIDTSTEDREHRSTVAGPTDPYQAELHGLARDVARECIINFHGGKS